LTSLREAVHAKIELLSADIAERAAAQIAEETVKKRVALIVQADTEIGNLEKELRRLKPDLNQYSESGEVITSNYSKDRYEAKKKLTDRRAKISKLLEMALADSAKFSELASAIGKQDDKKSSDDA
jgi:hypothetical protein